MWQPGQARTSPRPPLGITYAMYMRAFRMGSMSTPGFIMGAWPNYAAGNRGFCNPGFRVILKSPMFSIN